MAKATSIRHHGLLRGIVAVMLLGALMLPSIAASQTEQRTVFVHLFEWKWNDVAKECQEWLGPKGFAAVQISPAQEHPVITVAANPYPWYQRYQPVSYALDSRSGSRQELADMISRCNQAGVKVYADAVINHMAGIHTPAGQGTAGTSFDPQQRQYPGVPYGPNDFHGQCDIDYSNAESIRNCWIAGGLPDLKVETEYVRQKIADHMNDLISIGVAGFRIDGGKHMRPEDLSAILAKVNNIGLAIDPNTGKPFHSKVERPYIFIEVIGAEPVRASDYLAIGNVTEFDYGPKVAGKFRDPNQKLAQLKTFPGHPGSADWGLVPSFNAVAFLDNHDNQRGHGNGAWQADGRIANILTFHYDGNLYNLANVFMLAWPYGYPDVMSSYRWPINVQWAGDKFNDVNDWMGPPADGQGHTKDVNCSSGEWVCEHRWDNIAEMVAFRNYTGRQQEDWTVTHWWDNGADQIAFGRNGKGFVVINRGGGSISKEFDTGMPAGQYCEVLHADFNPQTKTCVGVTVKVDKNGKAVFKVGEGQAAAIYGGARVGGS
jgi:alpha-amylase